MKKIALLLFVLSVSFAYASAQATGTVAVTVGAEAVISASAATLTNGATNFSAPFTGTTTVTYSIRTTKTGGTGSITAKVTTDFSCITNGPCVATPPTGDALKYVCAGFSKGALGTCTTAVAISTSTAQTLATFGADAHANADTGTLSWTMNDDPLYPTGTYTATVTYTISAS